MARQHRPIVSHPKITSGVHTNGHLPPSTLAAQLVQNHARVNGLPQTEGKAVFGQLLQEILTTDGTVETDPEVNYKLVTVVAEAGLDVLLREDPFAEKDQLIRQAKDSIAVIGLTAQRNPEILFRSNPGGENTTRYQLYLWLFPKLLPLIGRRGFEAIQNDVEDVLRSFISILSKSLYSWQQLITVIQLYQRCTEDILISLENARSNRSPSTAPFTIVLPSTASIGALWPGGNLPVALPYGCQATINGTSHAFLVAAKLTSVVISANDDMRQARLFRGRTLKLRNWALDICCRLIAIENYATEKHGFMHRNEKLTAGLLSTFQILVPTSPKGSLRAAESYRVAQALIHCIEGVLQLSDLPNRQDTQQEVAHLLTKLLALSRTYPSVFQLAREKLLLSISSLVTDEMHFPSLVDGLQASMLRNIAKEWLLALKPDVQQRDGQPNLEESSFRKVGLLHPVMRRLSEIRIPTTSCVRVLPERPAKRRKITPPNEELQRGSTLPRLELVDPSMFMGQASDLLPSEYGQDILNKFIGLSAENQTAAMTAFSVAPCTASKLNMEMELGISGTKGAKCTVCDAECKETAATSSRCLDEDQSTCLAATLSVFIESHKIQSMAHARVHLMACVQRFAEHTAQHGHLDLRSSILGQYCLRSLQSSLRELRIAAGRALPAFIRDNIEPSLRRRNRVTVLDVLRTLSEKGEVAQQESLILAWSQVGSACGQEELNIVLLRLVEYLGHSNPFVSGLAITEISRLAQAFDCTIEELFRPFWRSIAIAVVKDLHTCPQKAQHLSDLLSVTVNQLLFLTQTETIPYLVLTRRRELLQRIALAHGPRATIKDVCLEARNEAYIVAAIFLQNYPDVEAAATEILRDADPDIVDAFTFAQMAKHEPVLAACELLKMAGDEDDARKPRVHNAIRNFAVMIEAKSGQPRTASKQSRLVSAFFEAYVLGIMAYFSETIGGPKSAQCFLEKKRALRAIGEMLCLAQKHASIALPQIRACLQSAVDTEGLRDEAFAAWASLLRALEEADVEMLIPNIFSIIVQYWDSLSSSSQQSAYDLVAYLLKTYSSIVRNNISTIPSLASISLLSKFEAELSRLKEHSDLAQNFKAFSYRCSDENAAVVIQAFRELEPFLEKNQRFIHEAAASEHGSPAVGQLTRAILDASVRFSNDIQDISQLCGVCLGLIGCVDPNRVEAVRERREILVLSNFERAVEAIDFVAFFLEQMLVKAFYSTTNARSQGFLAYVMQELLRFCGFNEEVTHRPRSSQPSNGYHRWIEMPESVRNTLTPFLTSRYVLRSNVRPPEPAYPIFPSATSHAAWLREFVLDLMFKATGDNAKLIFSVLARIIRNHDISISNFLFPFAVLNVVIGGTQSQIDEVAQELLAVLSHDSAAAEPPDPEKTRLCSENVFHVLDYLSRWVQEKKKALNNARSVAARAHRPMDALEEVSVTAQIESVENVISSFPAKDISRRAVECKSYARALFHWEQHIRQEKENLSGQGQQEQRDILYQRLQGIYTQIDEPDGIEGISAHLQILNPDQQVLEHKRAGRWSAAQSSYELSIAENPDNTDLKIELLKCLKIILKSLNGFRENNCDLSRFLPYAAEASWMTGKWQTLHDYLGRSSNAAMTDFNVGLGRAFLAVHNQEIASFHHIIHGLREAVLKGLSMSNSASIQACHDQLLKLHALYEIENIVSTSGFAGTGQAACQDTLDRRLDVLGAFTADKQYLLGLRRASMELSMRFSKNTFSKLDVAHAWLTTARLARKANLTNLAFDAVLHASRLGDESSKIEHSRLLWKEGHYRKAIQSLEGAISANAFSKRNSESIDDATGPHAEHQQHQNLLSARAHLLLAKWLDQAGQTQASTIQEKYQFAVRSYKRWEKGQYYLGRYYNKLLEAQKSLPSGKQSQAFMLGETVKLVIDSYLRSLAFGAKYLFQTLPKILTLWLDFGAEVLQPVSHLYGDEFRKNIIDQRPNYLESIHKQLRKYMSERIPAYMLYTALAQAVSRICHPNQKVYEVLSIMINRVVASHPQQALWTLLAMVKSSAPDRASRGLALLAKVKDHAKKLRTEGAGLELRSLINQGQKLSEQLLHACEASVNGRSANVSLSKDLGFNHKVAPCPLVVPLESTLTASLPTAGDAQPRGHKAFSRDTVTISSFSDDVLVLSSLQRPRKLTVRGSNGRNYGLLCKPKDDLRKDQRLMEFNAMINRALKRDTESSKRRLYIKTYAVTPLNEECGAIEWVDNLKPMRDILIKLYKQRNVAIDYAEIRELLTEASAAPENLHIFTDTVLPKFQPALLHEWFTEAFPEPDVWFAARLRYTRSCAVMSMVGHILGLGDRHGENILLEETSGGVFHVDFNCLFDKGLTFEKPEMVPFRLTHNMVDAFGAYGVEGPFRRSAELAVSIMRRSEDALLCVLETFVWDPTQDFVGRRKKSVRGVPETPRDVLENVKGKVRGLLSGESVPLSVEGFVDALIRQATSPANLAAMYIGWCAFF